MSITVLGEIFLRARIIMAAAEEINFRGFKFTMSDLTKRLSISKSSLYEYFSSKHELITIIIDKAQEDIQAQDDKIYSNSELSIIEKFQALVIVTPKLFGPISDQIYYDLRNNYPDEWHKVIAFRQERMDRLITMIVQGMEASILRPINYKVLRQLIIGAMNDLFDYQFLAENNMTYHDAIDALSNLIVYGMMPNHK